VCDHGDVLSYCSSALLSIKHGYKLLRTSWLVAERKWWKPKSD
jgi:hypothetical protein